mmetsp:Transcript_127593/g.190193  ORF Transcript_127593/g.190193 Transcript_127593/m.190193 type:complete len:220 (-) Transcript_127593:246-905(-)
MSSGMKLSGSMKSASMRLGASPRALRLSGSVRILMVSGSFMSSSHSGFDSLSACRSLSLAMASSMLSGSSNRASICSCTSGSSMWSAARFNASLFGSAASPSASSASASASPSPPSISSSASSKQHPTKHPVIMAIPPPAIQAISFLTNSSNFKTLKMGELTNHTNHDFFFLSTSSSGNIPPASRYTCSKFILTSFGSSNIGLRSGYLFIKCCSLGQSL